MRKRPAETSKAPAAKVPIKKEPLNTLPPKKMVITKNGIEYVEAKPEEPKKKDNNKYVKVSTNEPSEVFKEIGDRVGRKELKWAYYTTENSVGVHYYLILNQ